MEPKIVYLKNLENGAITYHNFYKTNRCNTIEKFVAQFSGRKKATEKDYDDWKAKVKKDKEEYESSGGDRKDRADRILKMIEDFGVDRIKAIVNNI